MRNFNNDEKVLLKLIAGKQEDTYIPHSAFNTVVVSSLFNLIEEGANIKFQIDKKNKTAEIIFDEYYETSEFSNKSGTSQSEENFTFKFYEKDLDKLDLYRTLWVQSKIITIISLLRYLDKNYLIYYFDLTEPYIPEPTYDNPIIEIDDETRYFPIEYLPFSIGFLNGREKLFNKKF